MHSLSIILPTYNERKNIAILIPQIEEVLMSNKINGEVIVVDDSSPDGTHREALKLNRKYKNIRVIVRKRKAGIGSALREGYNAARGELILSMDSDLSFTAKDILKFIKKINEGYDLVVGSRHISQGGYEKKQFSTVLKGFVSRFGNKMVMFISGVKIHDFSANFRIIKKSVWRSIRTKENTNTVLLEMILKSKYLGYKVAEIPVTFKERVYGESKLNLARESPKFFIKLLIFVLGHKLGR